MRNQNIRNQASSNSLLFIKKDNFFADINEPKKEENKFRIKTRNQNVTFRSTNSVPKD